jgi:subtilisin family serine protease
MNCKASLFLGAFLTGAYTLTFAADLTPKVPVALALAGSRDGQGVVDARLAAAKGTIEIIIQLDDPPLAVAHTKNAKKTDAWLPRDQQRGQLDKIQAKQAALLDKVRALGGFELGRMSRALNAVAVRIDAAQLQALTSVTNIISIRPVVNYEVDLSETVPYVGAAAVQAAGFDGTGVRVAVLDSGVDYTHRNFGGPATAAAYTAAYGTATNDSRNTTLDGLFPTAKVIGGYDFVGEAWPGGPLAPDPDPIAAKDTGGHGSHVADIIAGRSADGTHKGVAPGAKIYAVKVCSAVSTSCSGIALLEGMEFALDPNGDGDLSDAADVINMSLGSSYGQKEDDLSAASANAVRLGVIVVTSAGNAGDKPYVLGSPSSTPEVISVAQTEVPSAKRFPLVINSPASIAGQYKNTETVGWAPVGAGFTGDVVYVGRGCPAAGSTPADPYLANPAGKVALIDRGSCAVSLKVDRAAKAGAIGVLIAMVDNSDPISFSFGGGNTFVPTLIITRATGNAIKANLTAPVNVTVSPSIFVPLAGSMVSSSSRGPNYSYNAIKPDIGAPGGSVSAEAGTGTGETSFGGTSGASPMVAGAAALLVQAYPDRSPAELKSLLMNSAETSIQINPALQPGVLAPITRIGGGELRVNRALLSTTAAWDKEDETGSLSFGYHAVTDSAILMRKVIVRNYSDKKRTYAISSEFRYADDAATGAVSVDAPATIKVPAHGKAEFEVKLRVDASKLPVWNLDGGIFGGSGPRLQGLEFDGYLHIKDATDDIHLAWQVLPHKAADVSAHLEGFNPKEGGTLVFDNRKGAADGGIEVFSLTGESRNIPKKFLPGAGDNFALIDLQSVGVRPVDIGGGAFGVQFGIHTRGIRSHPNYPAEFDVYVDNNRDGTVDFIVYNTELNGFAATGQNVVFVYNVATKAQQAFFFSDGDLNSGNIILTAPLAALGLTPTTQFDFAVLAFDNYFTGNLTDFIDVMTHTLATPTFAVDAGDSFILAAGGKGGLSVSPVAGGEEASPSQIGLLLFYRDAQPGAEADAIKLRP